jgi:hypothetical protein
MTAVAQKEPCAHPAQQAQQKQHEPARTHKLQVCLIKHIAIAKARQNGRNESASEPGADGQDGRRFPNSFATKKRKECKKGLYLRLLVPLAAIVSSFFILPLPWTAPTCRRFESDDLSPHSKLPSSIS